MKNKAIDKISLKVLYLEDSPRDVEIIRELLTEAGYNFSLECTDKKKEFASLLQSHTYDVILSDFSLPGFDAFGALRLVLEICPDIPFICVSGSIGEETAIELIKQGAFDYVLKDRMARLSLAIQRTIDEIKEKKSRRQAEEALKKTEARFRSYFELSIAGIAITSPTAGWLEVNDHLCEMLGYSREELIKKNWHELTHPDDLDIDLKHFNRALAGEIEGYSIDKRFICKNKKIIWTSLCVRCVRLEDGKVDYFVALLFDISDRKRAEEKIRDSEEKYRSIYNNSNVGILLTIPDGTILSANDFACKLFGMTEEEICQRGRDRIVDSTDPRLSISLDERKRKGRIKTELTFIRKDGTKFEGEVSSVVFVDSSGKERTSMIIQDLTNRKLAENKLLESERKLNESQKMAQLGHWSWDVNTGKVEWSEEIFKIFRLDPKEFTPQIDSILALSPWPGDHERDRELIRKAMESHEKGEYEQRFLRPDKSIGYYFSTFQGKYDDRGNLVAIIGTVQDITERKRAEEKIVEQARLIEVATDTIIVRDMDDRLMFWNKAAEKLYGWTFEEACSLDIRRLVVDEERDKYEKSMQEFMLKGEWEGEFHQKTKDGRVLLTYSRWTLVRDKEGKPTSRLIITQDVTQQRTLESQLLRAQRLENLGALAGGIAHDLNNVLAPVLMAVQLLEKRSVDPQIKEITAAVEKNIMRGRDIIKQVLMFARGGEEGFSPQQLRYIIDEMRSIIRETFPRNIVLRANVAEDLKSVLGDSTQLHQVLMNLCVNARDAMPDGGQLKITASNIAIDKTNASAYDGMNPGSYVLLIIADTGTGIPKEIQEKIFQPFFTTKEVGKGTGLGLSTVITIIKSHRGSIKLLSETGKGTEFRIYLPAIREEEPALAVEKEKNIQSSRGETILLVDDELAILQISKEALETYGYHVITEINGVEAISKFSQVEKGLIQLAIIDSNMPMMDGMATITALRELDPKIKIILSSGSVTEAITRKFEQLNIQGTLIKPYTAKKMLETVWSVLHEK
jgi:PAS domain S-box-containing protein